MPEYDDHPRAKDLSDPISDVTRRERRTLLLVSSLLLAIVFGDLVPTRVESLGLTLEPRQQSALMLLLGAVEIYLLFAFVIYSRVDIVAWQSDFQVFLREKARSLRAEVERSEAEGTATAQSLEHLLLVEWPSENVLQLRRFFDQWVPIVVALVTIFAIGAKILGNL